MADQTKTETKTIAETVKPVREFLEGLYNRPDDGTVELYEPTDEDEIEAKKLVDLIEEWGLTIGR
jgi:hypothetical protein